MHEKAQILVKNGHNNKKTEKTENSVFLGEKPWPRIVQKDRKNRDRIVRSGNSNCYIVVQNLFQRAVFNHFVKQGTENMLSTSIL